MAANRNYSQDLLRLQEQQARAINETDDRLKQWESFRSDYKALQARLKTLPDKVTHDVMVPFGTLAFMPGQLVHTNEVMALLGDNWFVERSAKEASEIIQRRLTNVEKQIEDLKKERQLLTPRADFTSDLRSMTEGEGEVVDIREDYDEEKEKQWKDKHRQNVQAYRKKVQEGNADAQKDVITDEQLWARLEELEVIETRNRELDRLSPEPAHALFSTQSALEEPGSGEEMDESDTSDDTSYSASEELDSDDVAEGEDGGASSMYLQGPVITFSHSCSTEQTENAQEADGSSPPLSGDITTPADIYKLYHREAGPKSILKKSSANPALQKKNRQKRKERLVAFEGEKSKNETKPKRGVMSMASGSGDTGQTAFSGTVVEKSQKETESKEPAASQMIPAKPVSKFKSSQADNQTTPANSVSVEAGQEKPVSRFKAQRASQGDR